MIRCRVRADESRLLADVGPRETDIMRTLPGWRFDKDQRQWWAPKRIGSLFPLWGAYSDEVLEFDESGAEFAQAAAAAVAGARHDKAWRHPEPLNGLLQFQADAQLFLSTFGEVVLADDMGLGKTVQIAALLKDRPSTWPLAVICPNGVKRNWEFELKRFGPDGVHVYVITGTATQRRKAFEAASGAAAAGEMVAVVINYEAARLHSRLAPYGSIALTEKERALGELNTFGFRTVVVDEAHRMKDPKSKQTRAVWAIGHGDTVTRRYALTGTPLEDNATDFWPILHFVSPGDFPSMTRFRDRYVEQQADWFGNIITLGLRPSTEAEFRAVLEPHYIRRTKAEVLPDLPAKTYQTRLLELTTKQAKAYKDMAKEMLAKDEAGQHLLALDPLSQYSRLRQIASALPVLGDGEDLTTEVVALGLPSNKIEALLELLQVEAPDDQLVVFAEHRKLIELAAQALAKAKIEAVQITGAVPEQQRYQNIEQFQHGHAQVALVTQGAGGEGITLTAASRAVFLQRHHSLIKNLQAEDRILRIGQEADKAEIIDFVSAGTIEEAVMLHNQEKEGRLQDLVQDPGWIERNLFG